MFLPVLHVDTSPQFSNRTGNSSNFSCLLTAQCWILSQTGPAIKQQVGKYVVWWNAVVVGCGAQEVNIEE